MTMTRDELLSAARAEREALGRTIQKGEPARFDGPSPCEGWSSTDILAHLAAQEGVAAAALADEGAPELDAFQAGLDGADFTIDGFNTAAVAARREQGMRSIANEWGAAADQVLAHLAKVGPEEWDQASVGWMWGELSAADLASSRIGEWWLHGEDIRASVDLPPRIQHQPIYAHNDLAIRMLPTIMAAAGRSYTGHSVRVDLAGAGGGLWHQGLAETTRPDERKRPDVSIEAKGHAFALVVARRISADVFIDNGEVLLGGDEEIAYDILEHIRAYD